MFRNAHNCGPRRLLVGAAAAAAITLPLGCGDDDRPAESAEADVGSQAPAEQAQDQPGTELPSGGEGGGATEPSESDKEEMADRADELPSALETVESYFTSSDPDLVCDELVTASFLDDAYGGKQGCVLAQADVEPASSVRVLDDVAETGEDALKVAVIPNGGVFDGEEVEVSLILEDAAYRISLLRSHVPVGP